LATTKDGEKKPTRRQEEVTRRGGFSRKISSAVIVLRKGVEKIGGQKLGEKDTKHIAEDRRAETGGKNLAMENKRLPDRALNEHRQKGPGLFLNFGGAPGFTGRLVERHWVGCDGTKDMTTCANGRGRRKEKGVNLQGVGKKKIACRSFMEVIRVR